MENYSEGEQKKLDRIFLLKEREQFADAIEILLPLVKLKPDDRIYNGLLATMYYEMNNYVLSAKFFKRGTKLNPSAELPSLALFHSYMHLGETYLALKELIRFTSTNKYKSYKITIKELRKNINDFSSEEQVLINAIK
jgi:tetratricopeptide (TPR) repeat protein